MIARIIEKPLRHEKSFFLLGPRATGKTYWVKEALPDAIYINLLNSERYVELLGDPSRLRHLIPAHCDKWVVIDEVQRIPELLNEVHSLIEERKIKFVLTGSSARKLRKSGANLLAGRAITYNMHPLTVAELGEHFNLERSLQYGHLPAIYSEPDPNAYLKTYVGTYLREEVLQEGLTRNIAAFSRFLETASFSQGAVINMSEIARDVGIQQKMVTSYFDILDDLLLGLRLPIFNKRAKRKIIQHPKFYFFDVGVYHTLRPKGLLDRASEIDGAGLETLFLQELRAINDYYELFYDIYFWKTQSQHEVDFVIYGKHGFMAFEIKHAGKINPFDVKNLKYFGEEYPEAKLFLLYLGDQYYYFDNVRVMPLTDALKNMQELLRDENN